VPRLAAAAASASAAPGTRAVAAAITFSNVDTAAFASTQGVALIAASLASTIAGSAPSAAGVSVQVTRITDVATGVVVYSLGGARRQRRLQQAGASGVTVAFNVQVPASSPSGAETGVAALLQPAAGGGASAGFAAFATQAVVSIAAAAASAGNAALATGIAGAEAAVAAPLAPSAPSSPASGSSSAGGVALGAGLGGAAAVLLIACGVFYFRSSLFGGCGGADGGGPIVIGGKHAAHAESAKVSSAEASAFSGVNPAHAVRGGAMAASQV